MAVRAGLGAHFRHAVIQSDFDEFSQWVKEHNVQVIGTAIENGCDYHELAARTLLALLLGSERAGLAKCQLDICSQVVRIPMVGCVNSLNVAVAAGILLYAVGDKLAD